MEGWQPISAMMVSEKSKYLSRYIMIHPYNNYQIFPFKCACIRAYSSCLLLFTTLLVYTYTHSRVYININKYMLYTFIRIYSSLIGQLNRTRFFTKKNILHTPTHCTRSLTVLYSPLILIEVYLSNCDAKPYKYNIHGL